MGHLKNIDKYLLMVLLNAMTGLGLIVKNRMPFILHLSQRKDISLNLQRH